MEEKKQIALIFIVTLLIGVAAFFIPGQIESGTPDFSGDLIVDSYEVTWNDDGTLTEHYVYNVRSSGDYQMLYRVWAAPLFSAINSKEQYDRAHIELTDVKLPENTAGYIKTKTGDVYLFNSKSSSLKDFVAEKAYPNEAGIVNTGHFSSGKYAVEYTYNIYPPVEYDEEAAHINLMLASDHIPYSNVRIVLDSDMITKVFTHPPGYDIKNEDGKIVITGNSPENQMIEVEMLLSPEAADMIPGYKEYVSGVIEKTESANSGYELGFTVASVIIAIGKLLVLLTPFLLLALYIRVGREKKFTVPKYLSTIPNKKITPWQANLLFKGDAFTSDENGFYATILALHKEKKIKITEKDDKKGVLIEILDSASDDRYEQRVLNFINVNSGEDGILDTGYFEEVSKSASRSMADERIASALKENLNSLMSESDESLSSKYAVDGRGLLLPFYIAGGLIIIISIGILFLFPDAAGFLFIAALTGALIIIQAIIATVFPTTLFGHWKEDYYKEKLEWNSFKNFLSDLSRIKEYGTEDLNMWGEWLIYGTALGVGDKVAAAMKELDVDVSRQGYFYPHYIWFAGFYAISSFSPPSQGASGGGFGAGGGFGGGGAGGR